MYRYFANPNSLFCFGMFQSLFPYFYWWLCGPNQFYIYDISYVPALVWIIGYFSFWTGSWLKTGSWHRRKPRRLIFIEPVFRASTVKTVAVITAIMCIIQIIFAVRLYGVFPLLGYALQQIDVSEVNELQKQSGFGQFGLLMVSYYFLNAIILTCMIVSVKQRSISGFFILILLFIEFVSSTLAGKRQGFVISLVFLFIGLSIYFNDPLGALFRSLGLRMNKCRKWVLGVIVILLCLGTFSYMESMRIHQQIVSFNSIIRYLELPLINFEGLNSEIGLGPHRVQFSSLLVGFIPYKWLDSLGFAESALPLLEPTTGYGFYGGVILNFGLLGVILFSIFAGALSRYFYDRSFHSFTCLLIYCQLAWTLVGAHTYNFILSAHFLWAPALSFALLSHFVCRHGKPIRVPGHGYRGFCPPVGAIQKTVHRVVD